jgi:hypothetical protein
VAVEAALPGSKAETVPPHSERSPRGLRYDSHMIRIAISLAAYQAIASTMPEGRTARPPEPLEVGEGLGVWFDHVTLAALRREGR